MKNKVSRSSGRYFLLLSLLPFACYVNAGNVENLAVELAKIRGEVEELQTQLDMEKESHHNEMRVLTSQLTDLSVEERRQNVSIEKMQQTMEKYAALNAEAEGSGQTLKPVLLNVLNDYKRFVETGFPFKTEERLALIKTLQGKIEKDLLEPKKAANQIWAFMEDEIRLSKGNGIYQQTINLKGERILADIAKLGTTLLYFQTRDNRVGMAQKKAQGGWEFILLEDREGKEMIGLLFESLKKQIRQGYFQLPNPLRS